VEKVGFEPGAQPVTTIWLSPALLALKQNLPGARNPAADPTVATKMITNGM